MKQHSSPRNALCLGSALFILSAGLHIAVAAPSQPSQSIAPTEPLPTETQTAQDSAVPPANTSNAGEESESKPLRESNEYGPIKKGETLAQIAMDTLPDHQVGLEQMTWALYTMNPQAFENGDLNKLRTGVYLKVPNALQAGAIDLATARRELNRRVPPPAAPRAAARPAKQATAVTAKAVDPTEQLQSQIRITQREREEAAQEHQLLKNRLAEMEKKIQELMQQNAERDAALKAQARSAK